MATIARVLDSEVKGDGTIENTVRVDAPTESAAKRKAKNASLRHNGYSDAILQAVDRDIEVEVMGASELPLTPLRRRFIVNVKTTGVGEYFKG